MKSHIFSLSLFVAIVFGQLDQDPPDASQSVMVATIAQGTVMGFKASDGEYFQFYGIPYADSPAGEHRFKVSYINLVLKFDR